MLRNRALLVACLLLLVVSTPACFKSKTVVSKVEKATSSPTPNGQKRATKTEGVFYALPRTVVRVDVPLERVDKKPGKFGKFARCFLPDESEGRVKEEKTVFSLKDPTFTTRGEPDPDEIYMVNIKGGLFETKSMLLDFAEGGVLTKAEAESKNEKLDFVVKAATTAIGIGADIAGLGVGVGSKALTERGGDARERLEKQSSEDEALIRCRGRFVVDALETAAGATKAARKASETALAVATAAGDASAIVKAKDALIAVKDAETKIKAARTALDEEDTAARGLEEKLAKLEEEDATAQRELEEAISGANGKMPAARSVIKKKRDAATKAEDAVNVARDAAARKKQAALGAQPGAPQPGVETAVDNAITAAADAAAKAQIAADAAKSKDAQASAKSAVKTATEARGVFDDREMVGFRRQYLEAERIARRISELQQQKDRLLSGAIESNNVPADTIKVMLEQLQNTIGAYKNKFFLGTSETNKWTATLEFKPTNIGSDKPRLFKFSEEAGVCGDSYTVGGQSFEYLFKEQELNVPEEFQCQDEKAKAEEVALAFALGSDGKAKREDLFPGRVEAAKLQDKGERGFYYRIPAPVLTTLTVGTDERARSPLRIAQAGITTSLPATTGGRRSQYTITLDEASGALKNFKLGSDALIEKSIIDETKSAATEIIDLKDPLNKLKREREILEERNKILVEQEKLKNGGKAPEDK